MSLKSMRLSRGVMYKLVDCGDDRAVIFKVGSQAAPSSQLVCRAREDRIPSYANSSIEIITSDSPLLISMD